MISPVSWLVLKVESSTAISLEFFSFDVAVDRCFVAGLPQRPRNQGNPGMSGNKTVDWEIREMSGGKHPIGIKSPGKRCAVGTK